MRRSWRVATLLSITALAMLVVAACSSSAPAPAATAGKAAPAGQAAPAAASKDVIKLKLGHDQSDKHPYHLGSLFFAKRVNELTNGKVEITVFPSAQLGNELSMLDTLRVGDLDMSISAAPNASTHVAELGFFSVSYLFNDKDHFLKVMTDPEFLKLIEGKVTEKKIGFRPLGFLTAGLRSLYNNQRPVKTLDDVKGLKMRVMASPIESKVWQTLGTLPTSIPFGEIYTSMQTGVIQAAEGAPVTYTTSKHYEVAKNFALTEHQWLVTVLWMSDKTWEKLPADVQKAMSDAAKEMTKQEIELNVQEDQKAVEEAKTKGATVTEVDKAAFKAKLSTLQTDSAKELGMEKALEMINAAGKK